jgi:hypothetical protein
MGRFVKNAVEGKPDEARSGWRARQEKARQRANGVKFNRAEIAAQRAAHAQAQRAAEEQEFNPEVQAGGDFISAMSDADLVALYKELHDRRAPAPKAKRPAIERAVRAKQAERAAQPPEPEAEAELQLDQPADDDTAEDDV